MSFYLRNREVSRQILLELALAVSGKHTEEELLNDIPLLFLKKLQCKRVLVAKMNNENIDVVVNTPPTRNSANWQYGLEEMKVRAAKYHSKRFCEFPSKDKTVFYGFRLGSYGIVIFENHEKWTSELVNELVSVVDAWGNSLSLAVEIERRMIAEQNLNQQYQMLQILLSSASSHINTSLIELDEAINSSLESVARFLKADRGYMFHYDWQGRLVSNTHEWCAENINPEIENLQSIPMEMLPQWIEGHRKGNPLVVESVDELNDINLKDILQSQKIKSLITLPLMHKEDCLGFVGFDFVKEAHKVPEKLHALLRMFASTLVSVKLRIVNEKRSEEYRLGLEKSRLRFRNLVERINDLVFILNKSFKNTYVSPNYKDFMGYHPNEGRGQYPMRVVHNDDKEKLKSNLQKVLSGKLKTAQLECRMIDNAGKVKFHRLRLTANEIVNERVVSIAGAATDITPEVEYEKNLKKSRDKERELARQYEAVLNNSSVSILKISNTGKIIYVNECYSERMGFVNYSEGLDRLVGNDFTDNLLTEERSIFKKKLAEVTKGDGNHRTIFISRDKTTNGEIKGSSWELAAQANEKGVIDEFLLIGFDITKQLLSWMRTYELLTQRDRLRENEHKYSYILSHNLRRHAANIKGITNLLNEKRENLNGDAATLGMLSRSAVDLDDNIYRLSSMLEIDNIDKSEYLIIKDVLENVLKRFSERLKEINAQVNIYISPSDKVYAKFESLRDVLESLLASAIKNRSADRPLQIVFQHISSKNTFIMSDNGKGIPELVMKDLSVAAKKGHLTQDGRAFNLFLNRIKLESMQGRLKIKSDFGEGATFELNFPSGDKTRNMRSAFLDKHVTQEIRELNKELEQMQD